MIRGASGAWSSASARMSRAPNPGSTRMAAICTATGFQRQRASLAAALVVLTRHAAFRHFRTHGIAGGPERNRTAHHRHVPAVAARHRAHARGADRAGAAHHLGLSVWLRRWANLLRPAIR